MENKNLGLINHDDFTYQEDPSTYDEEEEEEESVEEDDDAILTGDKTDQEFSTHELKNDDSESIQYEDVVEYIDDDDDNGPEIDSDEVDEEEEEVEEEEEDEGWKK